jgi:hypothetical protein
VASGKGGSWITAGTRAQEPGKSEKPSAEDVIKLWSPQLKTSIDYHQAGGSPKQYPNVAAFSFRVVGPTFEESWNHYAGLCGMKKRYTENTLLSSADAGPNGSIVVTDRSAADGKGCPAFHVPAKDRGIDGYRHLPAGPRRQVDQR